MRIRHGINRIRKDHRDLSFPRTFGSVGTYDFPATLNVDARLSMPDQNADGLPEACTGYTTTDLESDVSKLLNKPIFTYAKTLMMEGKTGQYDQPCDIRDSLRSAGVYGVQRTTETTDAQALQHRCGAYFNVIDSPDLDAFDDIRNAILTKRRSVSSGTPWFGEWEGIGSNGVIPTVYTGNPDNLPWHNWKICGWVVIDGEPYLIGKTWQGSNYGDKGYAYFPRSVINSVMAISGTGAFTLADFDPNDPVALQTVKMEILDTVLSYLRMWVVALFAKKTAVVPSVDMSPSTELKAAPAAGATLEDFCLAIRDNEGAPGDLNYQNNNPGNCRCSSVGYATMYGNVLCVETKSGKFAKFPTYALGWLYLNNLVKSRIHLYPNWTIYQFIADPTHGWSPAADGNDPENYAQFIGKRLGVDSHTFTIGQLIQ